MTTTSLDLVVEERIEVADGVAAFAFARPDGGKLPEWQPGAHVDLFLGPDLTRQYSLCGDPAEHNRWRIAVPTCRSTQLVAMLSWPPPNHRPYRSLDD